MASRESDQSVRLRKILGQKREAGAGEQIGRGARPTSFMLEERGLRIHLAIISIGLNFGIRNIQLQCKYKLARNNPSRAQG